MKRPHPKGYALLKIVAGGRGAIAGTIDSETGTVTFNNGPPRLSKMAEGSNRHPAVSFLSMLTARSNQRIN